MSPQAPTSIRFQSAVPQFTVPDLVRTVEYYRDVLGFQIAGYWDGERASAVPDAPPVFAIVRRDQVQVFFNLSDGSGVRTGRAEEACDAYFHGPRVNPHRLRGTSACLICPRGMVQPSGTQECVPKPNGGGLCVESLLVSRSVLS